MALAMSKLGGLGGGGGSSGGGGGSHASQDPQDKIVCILLLTFIPLLIRVLQIALAMSQAGKLFDKKNAGTGGGAGSANNQAAKVQGPLPLTHFSMTPQSASLFITAMHSAATTAMRLCGQYKTTGKVNLEPGDAQNLMGVAMSFLK